MAGLAEGVEWLAVVVIAGMVVSHRPGRCDVDASRLFLLILFRLFLRFVWILWVWGD